MKKILILFILSLHFLVSCNDTKDHAELSDEYRPQLRLMHKTLARDLAALKASPGTLTGRAISKSLLEDAEEVISRIEAEKEGASIPEYKAFKYVRNFLVGWKKKEKEAEANIGSSVESGESYIICLQSVLDHLEVAIEEIEYQK